MTPATALVLETFGFLHHEHPRMPWHAADWLAEGRDGGAIRDLAALNERDLPEIAGLVPFALAETGAAWPGVVEAVGVWFEHRARHVLADESWARTFAAEAAAIGVHYEDSAAIWTPEFTEVFRLHFEDAWLYDPSAADDMRRRLRALCAEALT